MNKTWIAIGMAVAAFLNSTATLAQNKPAATAEFQPYSGQPGKDVVWVPTPDSVVNKMLDLAKVTAQDFLVDLGSGDGRTVITAAKRGVRAMGVEYNPDMVTISNREATRAGVLDKARFVNGDIFTTDFSQATVLTMYLLPSLNIKLRPTVLDMKPGTRVVSHAFNMGEWEPDETSNIEGRQAFLWLVPAKVAGNWTIQVSSQARELALQQAFQMLSGTLKTEQESVALSDARMRGEEIRFAISEKGIRRDFIGRVQGNVMSGNVRTAGQPETPWTAVKR